MNNLRYLSLNVLLFCTTWSPIYGMEVLVGKDPSINSDGVCHLAKLPKEILNLIAEYTIDHEDSEELLNRCITELKKSRNRSYSEKTPHGIVFLYPFEIIICYANLQRKTLFLPNGNSFIQQVKHNIARKLGITKSYSLLDSSLSPCKNYLAILEKKYDYDNGIDNQSSDRLAKEYCIALHLMRLKDLKIESICIEGLPIIQDIIPLNNLGLYTGLINAGYDISPETNYYLVSNPLDKIAISFDHKQIAIANSIQIFITQKNQNNTWVHFKLLKTLSHSTRVNYTGTHSVNKSILALTFNKQGTQLLVTYSDDTKNFSEEGYHEIIQLKKGVRLHDYFREKGICKSLS